MYLITFCLYQVRVKDDFRRLHIEQSTGEVFSVPIFSKVDHGVAKVDI